MIARTVNSLLGLSCDSVIEIKATKMLLKIHRNNLLSVFQMLTMENKTGEKESLMEKDFRDTGFRKSKTTLGFRLINPELFVKPVRRI